jgi:hypothetical protein
MKMLALITDGEGRLHVASTRSPDLLRRELAGITGSAILNHVCIPSGGARPVAEYLERQLVSHRIAPGVYDIAFERVVAMLARRETATWFIARFVRPVRRVRNHFIYHLAEVLR